MFRLARSCAFVTCALSVCLLAAGCDPTSGGKTPDDKVAQTPPRRESFRTKYNALLRTRNYEAAERLVVSRLASHPNDLDALTLAARLSMQIGDMESAGDRFTAAAELASTVSLERADAIVVEWALARCNVGEIMAAIEDLKNRQERSVQQTRLLAQLFTIVGDMRGARTQYENLMSKGVLQSGESYQLACEVRRPHRKPEWLTAAAAKHPDDFRPQLATAVDSYENGQEPEAIQKLEAIATQHPGYQPALGLLIELLAGTGQTDRAAEILRSTSLDSWDHPAIWYGWGLVLSDQGSLEEAADCFANAVRLDPRGHLYASRLATTLSQQGIGEVARLASSFASRSQELRLACRTFSFDKQGSQSKCIRVVTALVSLGRVEEAKAWIELAKTLRSEPVADLSSVLTSISDMSSGGQDLSARLIAKLGERFDFERRRPNLLADVGVNESRAVDRGKTSLPVLTDVAPVVFVDEAKKRGMEFTYDHGESDGALGRWIYQTTGGGVAIGDFDLDGWEDAYFTQAGGKPTDANRQASANPSDALFWNREGQFVVADAAGLAGTLGYGQGVAAGDLNGDGFCDLVVGNIGRNQLLINRGDGTFADMTDQSGIFGDSWTSSVAIVDLNADGLGDVVEINYCENETSLDKECRDSNGEIGVCVPVQFAGSVDRLWISQGDGTFQSDESWADVEQLGRGLGMLVANLDQEPGVEVFVSNDMSSNHFWKRDSDGRWSDQAISRGLAVGADGRPQACMGIAWADLNRDQQLDFLVTNYSNESNAMYVQSQSGFFRDRSMALGVTELSLPMLGFGTVIADFNQDGYEDAFVANGRVTRNEDDGEPFRQPAQVLNWNGVDRWQDAGPIGDYFLKPHTGRAVAMLDADNDCRVDLIVGHLGEPSGLLMGRSQAGRVVCLELVGTQAERDAIGAEVQITTNLGVRKLQNVGGDGYFTTQSARIHISLTDGESVTSIDVRWPTGDTTHVEDVVLGKRMVVSQDGQVWVSPLDGAGEASAVVEAN